MSQSTIVSLVPFPIAEYKPGIYPGFFEIPGAKNDVPELLVIGDSVYHVELDENRTITVKCTSEDIARSVVSDYLVSNLAYNQEADAFPGLFWKPGAHDLASIIRNYPGDLELFRNRQLRWYRGLVELADDDWERTRQHKFISDIQRFAAKALKLERSWVVIPKVGEGYIKCPACSSSVPFDAIVCSSCRCILNKEKYDALKFAEMTK